MARVNPSRGPRVFRALRRMGGQAKKLAVSLGASIPGTSRLNRRPKDGFVGEPFIRERKPSKPKREILLLFEAGLFKDQLQFETVVGKMVSDVARQTGATSVGISSKLAYEKLVKSQEPSTPSREEPWVIQRDEEGNFFAAAPKIMEWTRPLSIGF